MALYSDKDPYIMEGHAFRPGRGSDLSLPESVYIPYMDSLSLSTGLQSAPPSKTYRMSHPLTLPHTPFLVDERVDRIGHIL